ncbi:MAG: RNA polymerase sigma factor [Planctomycetota bacterium]|jgi:RNA polymerase sigma-70 factor (ECF subfamily)
MPRPRPSKPSEPSAQSPADLGDLLDRFRHGEAAAFDRIVGEYERRLVQFFHRLCWDRGQAEDLTQALFLKLLRGAQRYRPQGRLSTFIFRIATNLWIDHYRAQRPRQPLYSLDQALLAGFDPESDRIAAPPLLAEQDEERRRLRKALEQLTEPHRLVFELAVYQELPYAQISEVLHIPVGTVKSRMHNSVRALKKILGPTDELDAAEQRDSSQSRASSQSRSSSQHRPSSQPPEQRRLGGGS